MSYKIVKLGEICDFQGGSQPPKSNFIFEPKKDYIRFIQIRDFKSDKNFTYIPISKKNNICKNTDILIGRYGASVGKILTGLSGAYNVALMKTIPNEKIIDKKFLHYYLISDLFQEPLKKISERSAQNGFSKDNIYNFSFALPTLLEQQRIIIKMDKIISEIDSTIVINRKNTVNFNLALRKMVSRKINDVFLKKGKIHLGDIAKFKNGINFSKSLNGTPVKILGVKDFRSNFYADFNNFETVFLNGDIKPTDEIIEGDIVFVRSNGNKELIGRSMLVRDLKDKTTFSGFTIRARLNNKDFLPEFVIYILKSDDVRSQLIKGGIGANISSLNQNLLSVVEIPILDLNEQQKCVSMFKKIEESKNNLKSILFLKKQNLERLKTLIINQEITSTAA